MAPRIYDIDGTEKDAAWLASTWDGCEVLPAVIPAGVTEYWRLSAVYCTTGPATLKAEVRRDATTPAGGQPVVATWPTLDNPSQDIDTLPVNPHNWAARGVIQRTEGNGITGFGLGGGKKHDEEGREVEEVTTYGPWYHMWVLSSVPSDCLSKTGMKGGTNHSGPLHGVWILTPVSPEYASLEDAMKAAAQAAQVIEFNKDAALQKAIYADGYHINSPEFDLTYGGITYRCQRAEDLGTGQVRCYFCVIPNWDIVEHINW